MSDNASTGGIPLHKRAARFFDRARQRFGDRYDYSRFEYLDYEIAGVIVCPDHGEFHQKPSCHLNPRSHGCPKCGNEARRLSVKGSKRPKEVALAKAYSADEYVKLANAKHGNRFTYDMTGYEASSRSHIKVTCPKHGTATVRSSTHLVTKHGCNQCSHEQGSSHGRLTYDQFLERAKAVNGDRYVYLPSNEMTYRNLDSKIAMVCHRHGPFEQAASRHVLGKQCRRCSREDSHGCGGYNEGFFAEYPGYRDMPAILYYAEINGGECYKIGITKDSAKARLYHARSISRGDIKVFRIVASAYMTLYEAFMQEQRILWDHSAKRTRRHWSTELFSVDIWPTIQHLFAPKSPDSS